MPNRPVAVEHAPQIGTRESSWTKHNVGGRCADHGRKQELSDGHIRDREPRPGICNSYQVLEFVNEKSSRDDCLFKIVLDGKRPITEDPQSDRPFKPPEHRMRFGEKVRRVTGRTGKSGRVIGRA